MPQFCGEIEVEVADVEFLQEFVALARVEAGGAQMFEDALADMRDEAIEAAAQGGFVDVELARELGQGALVQIPGREEEAVFGGEFAEGLVDGGGETGIGCGCVGFRRRREADAGLDLLFEADTFRIRPAAVDVVLGEDGAEPTFERATAHVVVELRDAAAFAVRDAVEVGVEFVGDFAAGGFVAGNAVGALI